MKVAGAKTYFGTKFLATFDPKKLPAKKVARAKATHARKLPGPK